jgi:hypothetical protein
MESGDWRPILASDGGANHAPTVLSDPIDRGIQEKAHQHPTQDTRSGFQYEPGAILGILPLGKGQLPFLEYLDAAFVAVCKRLEGVWPEYMPAAPLDTLGLWATTQNEIPMG